MSIPVGKVTSREMNIRIHMCVLEHFLAVEMIYDLDAYHIIREGLFLAISQPAVYFL